MDTLVKILCVVSFVWLAGWSAVIDGCESPGGPPDSDTPPDNGYPSNPDPSNGSTDVCIEPVLSWRMDGEMDDDEYTYDVYFGTWKNLGDPPLVMENLDSNEYYTGTLDFETTYAWRVVATDRYDRVSEGRLWSFTTYDGVILDEGFEGEFPPPGWYAGAAWNLSGQNHTGDSSACGRMVDYGGEAYLRTSWIEGYPESHGFIDLSFYYKPEQPDHIPYLEFYIYTGGGGKIELYSGWVENEDWALAEYTVSRSDLESVFHIVFRTYYEEPLGEDSVLIDDVLVKDSALK
jgi:hypothetical protein